MFHARLGSRLHRVQEIDATATLERSASEILGRRATRAMRVHGATWPVETVAPKNTSATIWVVGALIVLGLMLLLVEQPGLLLLEVIGALVLGGVFWGRGGSDHSGPTTPTEVQLVRGETAEFTLLMAQWDDLPDDASETTAAELARALRIAFDTARANAEALGLTHLPSTARPPARRAVKAAPHLPSRTLPRPRGSPTLWQCPSSPRGRWSPPTRRSHGCRATPSCSPPATKRSCTSPS